MNSRIDGMERIMRSINCPYCQSQRIHRSKPKGILELGLLALIFVLPFRCEKCDSRFFRWSISEKPGPAGPPVTSQVQVKYGRGYSLRSKFGRTFGNQPNALRSFKWLKNESLTTARKIRTPASRLTAKARNSKCTV